MQDKILAGAVSIVGGALMFEGLSKYSELNSMDGWSTVNGRIVALVGGVPNHSNSPLAGAGALQRKGPV